MTPPGLEVQGLYKSYPVPGGRLEVLRGVDLAAEPGTVVAVLGASGAGKSTLLHVLGSLDRPDSGSVRVGGRELFALAPHDLARFRSRTLGFVFQFHHLLPEFTALENVLMPARLARRPVRESARAAWACLERVGLTARAHHLPSELSGGEAQRVAVARALVNDPRLILADEPSGNLDRANADELHALLVEIAAFGPLVVVATHNERLAGLAGRVLVLESGKTRPCSEAERLMHPGSSRETSAEEPTTHAVSELPEEPGYRASN